MPYFNENMEYDIQGVLFILSVLISSFTDTGKCKKEKKFFGLERRVLWFVLLRVPCTKSPLLSET